MKSLAIKLVLPLTIISFALFTKWWHALPVDAPDTVFIGFPLAFACPGWHTSLSWQIFVTEFLIDFSVYFLFWFALLFIIDRFIVKIRTPKIATICLWIISAIVIGFWTLIASNKDNLFYTKRPFDMEIRETGFRFVWQEIERPNER